MRRFVLFALLCCVAEGAMLVGCGDDSTGPEPEPEPQPQMLSFAAIAGEWTGTVTQPSPPMAYVTVLTLETEAQFDSPVGTIEYTELCGGRLYAQQASEPNYRVSEHLTYGIERCINGGKITLTHDPVAGTLSYQWRLGGIGSSGVLTRPRAPLPGGTVAYTATDLGTLNGSDGWSAATDISDLTGGTLRIAGTSAVGANVETVAVRWEVNESGDVDGPLLLPLSDGFSAADARGISDDGLIIVGHAENLPVRWDREASWAMTELVPYDGYEYGGVFDVNNDGAGVGWSTSGSQTPVRVATRWDGLESPIRLPNPIHPNGVSRARGINNSGIVAGEVWDANNVSAQAILWLPDDTWCTLGPGIAHDLTDTSDGTILVAVSVDATMAKVWKVTVSSCDVTEWELGSSQVAFDVRATEGGWEAVGMKADAPMVWAYDGTELTATQLADDLKARGINQAGEIVGRSMVNGAWHGILWTPTQP